MSSNFPDPAERKGKRRAVRIAKGVGIVAVLAALGYFAWQWANDMAGVKRQAPQVPAIIPLPPPPPPPPEPEQPPPEPETKPEEVVEPEPQPEPEPMEEAPKPEDNAPPSPSDDLADPMQMDADSQAGSDAFNIGAGQGRGMSDSGGGRAGNATYSQYMAYALQKILREDDRTRNLIFRMNVDIWLNQAGQILRVELTRSSGDAEIDEKVIATLRAVPSVGERPPASVSMPIRASLSGRRPS